MGDEFQEGGDAIVGAVQRLVDKSDSAFRTISEVSDVLGVPQHVLRFWEGKFTQIRPLKRGGGRRYYRPSDVELLVLIKEYLYDRGYTIRGVQKLLKGGLPDAEEKNPVQSDEDNLSVNSSVGNTEIADFSEVFASSDTGYSLPSTIEISPFFKSFPESSGKVDINLLRIVREELISLQNYLKHSLYT